MPNLGGESQRRLRLPEMGVPHPREKRLPGWEVEDPETLPTSKKEEEACNI